MSPGPAPSVPPSLTGAAAPPAGPPQMPPGPAGAAGPASPFPPDLLTPGDQPDPMGAAGAPAAGGAPSRQGDMALVQQAAQRDPVIGALVRLLGLR